MNAVDTNVLVYAVDADEPAKQHRAQDLLRQLAKHPDETVILWQVAAEFLSCLRRWQLLGRVSSEDVELHISDLLQSFPLALPNRDVLMRSGTLHSRYSLSHWDSMLLAACVVLKVETLYSEDFTTGETYDGVTVIDPFA